MNPLPKRRMSFYEKYIKRVLDVTCCVLALIFFWWVYLIEIGRASCRERV